MEPQIFQYFKAERYESLLFLAVGFAALAASIYFLIKMKSSFHYGLSTALVLVAVIQIVVGYTVYSRTPAQAKEVMELYSNDRAAFLDLEKPRMEGVMRNFVIYRWVEIGLVILGLLLVFISLFPPYWKGLGAGLFLQGLLMLGLDFFAEKRGREYTEVVQYLQSEWTKKNATEK